jgi:fructosamine-3-kinase
LPARDTSDAVLLHELRALGRADQAATLGRLSGGTLADVWLITYADATQVVGKTVTGAAPDLFRAESDGLTALRDTGHLATPQVLAVTGRLLLLEALTARDDSERSWERFAHDLAAAHRSTAGTQFGWHHDGYLGQFRQVNTWTASGHQFFAEHRLLRYLSEPAVDQALTTGDRRAIERLCDRLPEIIPAMPSVLTHGDLWAGNLIGQPSGRITVIDPAVSRTWAEVDLSMLWGSPRPQPPPGSSSSTRNSTPPRPAGPTACPSCTCTNTSASSPPTAPPPPAPSTRPGTSSPPSTPVTTASGAAPPPHQWPRDLGVRPSGKARFRPFRLTRPVNEEDPAYAET